MTTMFYMTMDNMPAIMQFSEYYVKGFPIGYISQSEGGKEVLVNHLNIKVLVHQPKAAVGGGLLEQKSSEPMYRVVGFQVLPLSIDHKANSKGELTTCPGNSSSSKLSKLMLQGLDELRVVYSYSVEFEDSPIRWGNQMGLPFESQP